MRYLFLSILAVLILASCEDNEETTTYFKVKIDSLNSSDQIIRGDTLKVVLYGAISGDGTFDSFETKELQSGIELSVIARSTKRVILVSELLHDRDEFGNSSLGKTFKTIPKNRGDFTITINQPDGSKLQKVVKVE